MLHASALAGACAGLVSSIVTCPLDVVKTKLQAQSGPSRPLRSGWNGPAGHPNGGIGGGAAREAWERSLHMLAKQQGVSVAEIQSRSEGLAGTMRRIWTEDGIRGFYRGLGPTIFGYLPTWAIYFTVYDQCKASLANTLNPTGEEDFLNHILSAMTAGAASTFCTSPLWVVKTRFMLQSVKDPTTRPYRHTGDAFLQIYRTEGWRGFYRGLLPSLFGVSHVAVQFPLYENFKSWTRERSGSDELHPSSILMCSSAAKMIASCLTYPHEVLRTRLQMQPRVASTALPPSHEPPGAPNDRSVAEETSRRRIHTSVPKSTVADSASRGSITAHGLASPLAAASSRLRQARRPHTRSRPISSMGNTHSANKYTGVLQACGTIAREEGLRGFYRGMGVNLIRTVPSSALTILTYEVMMQHLTSNEHGDGNDDNDTSD